MLENLIALPAGMARATQREAHRIGDITADAFRDDPINRWLFGNYRGIRALFRAQARRVYLPRGFAYRIGDSGAAMWMMPGGNASLGLADYAAILMPTLYHCGIGAVSRALKTGEAMEAHHPGFEHAYLFSIGVRASERGKGLGRKLIAPVLEACDRAGVPAYLENTNPANAGFYASCGFVATGEIRPTPDAPVMIPMVREPRGA